jgi:hypothetical protein
LVDRNHPCSGGSVWRYPPGYASLVSVDDRTECILYRRALLAGPHPRGGIYGQRSREPRSKAGTHGRTDRCCTHEENPCQLGAVGIVADKTPVRSLVIHCESWPGPPSTALSDSLSLNCRLDPACRDRREGRSKDDRSHLSHSTAGRASALGCGVPRSATRMSPCVRLVALRFIVGRGRTIVTAA